MRNYACSEQPTLEVEHRRRYPSLIKAATT
jgi:hypothetical protein